MKDGLNQNMQGNIIQISSAKPGNGSFTMTVPRYKLELDSETFKSFAFKTHPLAYLDGGLASLQLPDMMKIMGGPALEEWGDWRTYEQVVAGDAWNIAKADIDDAVSKVLGRLMDAK
ncbi:hypothetical protein [Paraburkholderia sp. GAS82]|uniref:hypothetical protein n=1 Tax=Paraburkholderia sp. GAS82 TaxID=3035137 RepID=UPI003D247C86